MLNYHFQTLGIYCTVINCEISVNVKEIIFIKFMFLKNRHFLVINVYTKTHYDKEKTSCFFFVNLLKIKTVFFFMHTGVCLSNSCVVM